MSTRHVVGVERTILCATRFWSGPSSNFGPYKGRGQGTTMTLVDGVKHVARKQGHSAETVRKALKRLEKGGFIEMRYRSYGSKVPVAVRLTSKGGRVGCSTVKLAPWTDDPYPGSALRGLKTRKRGR